jgi:hypothetical protein
LIIEHALKTYLEAQSGLTALVSDRIYYVTAPQDVDAPYLVMTKISSVREHCMAGSSHLAHTRFQLTIVSETYRTAKLIAAQLQDALQGISGLKGDDPGVYIYACHYDNETDLYDNGFYQLALDFMISHED